MREMEILSDLAMITWVKKKEKIKAKQARKLVVADRGGWEQNNSSGGRQNSRESKRDQGGLKVKDAMALAKMEVEMEKLSAEQARAEAQARRRAKKEKRGLGKMTIVIGGEGITIRYEQETWEKGKATPSKPKPGRAFCSSCNRRFRDRLSLNQHLAESLKHNWCLVCFRDIPSDTALNHVRYVSSMNALICYWQI